MPRGYVLSMTEMARAEDFEFIDVTQGDAQRFAEETDYSDYHHMSPAGASGSRAYSRQPSGSGSPPGILNRGATSVFSRVVKNPLYIQATLVKETLRGIAAKRSGTPAGRMVETLAI